MVVHLFEALIIAHIITGTVGLLCIWVPILGRKGGAVHKRWGRVFAYSMLLPLLRVAAFTFAPYLLWVLFKEKRWGWLSFFAVLVGVPTVGAVLSQGSTAAFLDGAALVAFYLYCLLLKHAVGQWLAEAREWQHSHAMTPTA